MYLLAYCLVALKQTNKLKLYIGSPFPKMSPKSRLEELQDHFKIHNKSKEQKAHASKVSFILQI